ncbi:hypothetical protein NGRA_1522 [Nosema granulosis]|uniref:Bromodomain associated domain-containing protein n=1 Tax=Nosema granulosis TaxID=83296 RepID=A0A9P6GZA5_9MICR|nr:hypothetical protein NGRA_1522 [Nosema granulosis]
MKSNMNMKIIKLAMAEIVMQCGFERISEQALNIMGDIFRHYLEQITLRMVKMSELHCDFDIISRAIINDFLVEDSYQEKELLSFLHTQLQQKKYLGGDGKEDSLLHSLKVIPKSVDLTNVCRTTSSFLVPNIKNGSSNISLEVDQSMNNFIEDCMSERSRREEVGEYKYKLLEILSKDKNLLVAPTKTMSEKVTISLLSDFDYKERRKVFKNK